MEHQEGGRSVVAQRYKLDIGANITLEVQLHPKTRTWRLTVRRGSISFSVFGLKSSTIVQILRRMGEQASALADKISPREHAAE